ncbi:MAG: murein hydrolase activator EnvC family protein [Pseudomonadota bacterium]
MTALPHILFIVCGLVLTGSAWADKQAQLENLRQKISSLQQDIDKTDESKSEAADALRASERAISNSSRALADLGAQQRATENTLQALQTQGDTLSNTISGQQALLGKLLYRQYLGGQQEQLKLIFNGQDPNEVYRHLHYYQYIARNRITWINALRANLTELNLVTRSTQQQSEQLDALRKEHAAEKAILEKEKLARKKVFAKISRQLKQQRNEINQLRRNEKRLAQLVEKLAEMLAQPKSGGIFNNKQLPDNRFDDIPFASLKGKLSLPVKGQVTNRYGNKRPDSTVTWRGLFLKSASGQAVKTVAAGRVIFADWLRGFGNLLIVDHGDNYMSLYGNNETLYKQVGDVLNGGDTVAAVGNSGGNEDFGLYFEMRYKSEPFDPMQWMAAR